MALIERGAVIAAAHEVVGRGHAEKLVPMIAGLPGQGRGARILVDCGPGSFTGVRVGLAAARGLAIGWGIPVAGYSSLALVAASAFADADAPDAGAIVLEGGHGEVFVQTFSRAPFVQRMPLASLKPDVALATIGGLPAIGSGVARLLALDPEIAAQETLPVAADALHLPDRFAELAPRPIYGRAPDAKPGAART